MTPQQRLRPDEHRVAVAGDWHGNRLWAQQTLFTLRDYAPDVRTVLHVGDFGIWPEKHGKALLMWIDQVSAVAGLDQVLVTPGNHEDWDWLDKRFASRPGEAIELSRCVWVMPRGHRFQLAERTVLSFGGAVSLDRESRTEGRDWWPTEAPTDDDVDRAVKGGNVDIMIAHDAIHQGTRQVRDIIDAPSTRWPAEALADAEIARGLVTQVWEAVHPRVLVHGHFHVLGEIDLVRGQRVYSLAADGMPGNLGLIDLRDLTWAWVR